MIIFCRIRATVRELDIRMANEQHSVRELTFDLDCEQRAIIVKNFRVLISANILLCGTFNHREVV